MTLCDFCLESGINCYHVHIGKPSVKSLGYFTGIAFSASNVSIDFHCVLESSNLSARVTPPTEAFQSMSPWLDDVKATLRAVSKSTGKGNSRFQVITAHCSSFVFNFIKLEIP